MSANLEIINGMDISKMREIHGNSENDPVYGFLENPREIVFIDMDGVLCDMRSRMNDWSLKLGISPDELFRIKFYHTPGFYKDLPPIEGSINAFNRISEKYESYILTALAWENPSCYTDKRLWVEKFLGESAYKRLIISNDKSLFKGKALIDDRTKYGVTKFDGEHIHFRTERFPDWKSVLSHLEC